MTIWMTYAALVGALVAAAGWTGERLAAAGGLPRRGAWLVALTLAVVLPLMGRPTAGPTPFEQTTASIVPEAIPPAATVAMPGGARWDGLALGVWLVASTVGLGVIAAVLGLVVRARRRWRLGRVGPWEVYVSRRFGPALVGLARPAVVVPGWVTRMEADAADIIVRHEVEHRRGGDHLTLLFGGLITALFPWNPAVWWMSRRLRAAVEIDCDRRLLLAGTSAAKYGEVLLQVGARPRTSWGPVPALTEPKSLLERRLRTMGEGRRAVSGTVAAMLTALSMGLVAAACETPAPTDVKSAMEQALGARRADAQEWEYKERSPMPITFNGDTLFIEGRRILVGGEGPLVFINDELQETGFDRASRVEGLEPDDIARIEVLKSPASEKIFGPRGGAGVIQIYLKGHEPQYRRLREPVSSDLEEQLRKEAQEREAQAGEARRTLERAEALEWRGLESRERAVAQAEGSEGLRAAERALQEALERSAPDQEPHLELTELMERLSLARAELEARRNEVGVAGPTPEALAKVRTQVEELTRRLEAVRRAFEESRIRPRPMH